MKQRLMNLTQHLAKFQVRYITIVALFLVASIPVAPILFTSWSWYDLTKREYANIGDTIGGITAPIIGVISGFLIYITFYTQNQFNKQQITNADRDTLLDLFNVIREDINFLVVSDIDHRDDKYKGINAVFFYTKKIKKTETYNNYRRHPLRIELLGILRMFNNFLAILEGHNLNGKHMIIKQFVLSYYDSTLKPVLDDLFNALGEEHVAGETFTKIKTAIKEIRNSIEHLHL